MEKILSGTEVAKKMEDELLLRVEKLKESGVSPTIAVVRVGEKPQDISYEKGLEKIAEKLGIGVMNYVYTENVEEEVLLSGLERINADKKNHGILIFRPLPKQIDEGKALSKISANKDLDGVTEASMLGIYTNSKKGNPPCTAQACIEILKHYNIDVRGKKVTVLGRSLVVGKPLAHLLLADNATVSVCHSKSENLEELCRGADVLFVAVGRAKMVGENYLRKGQTVIDVGINVDENGKLCGDVNFEEAEPIVDRITPVPGGVGAVTSRVLMSHVVKMAEEENRC